MEGVKARERGLGFARAIRGVLTACLLAVGPATCFSPPQQARGGGGLAITVSRGARSPWPLHVHDIPARARDSGGGGDGGRRLAPPGGPLRLVLGRLRKEAAAAAAVAGAAAWVARPGAAFSSAAGGGGGVAAPPAVGEYWEAPEGTEEEQEEEREERCEEDDGEQGGEGIVEDRPGDDATAGSFSPSAVVRKSVLQRSSDNGVGDLLRSPQFKWATGLAVVGAGGIVALKKRPIRRSRTKLDRIGVKNIPPTPPPTPGEMDFELFGDEVTQPSPPAQKEPVAAPSPPADPSTYAALGEAKRQSTSTSATPTSPAATVPQETTIPQPSTAPPKGSPPKTEKKGLGGSLGKLFKKEKGPQRATTIEAALDSAGENRQFAQDLAAALCRSAPEGSFASLKSTTEENMESLAAKAKASGLDAGQTVDLMTEVVNAMVVSLTDTAVASISGDNESKVEALNDLLDFMEGAGGVFATLCPGAEVDPPIRYNGNSRRGRLEELYKAYATRALAADSPEGVTSSRLEQLQDLFSIKESKANGITQKILMDSMMKMMKEGGAEGLPDMSGLMEGLGALGGMPGGLPSPGSIPGLPEGMPDIDPKEMAAEMKEFKEMVKSGNVSEEEVIALRNMYKEMGMDIDDMCRTADSAMSALDPEAKELFQLLKGLLSKYPKRN